MNLLRMIQEKQAELDVIKEDMKFLLNKMEKSKDDVDVDDDKFNELVKEAENTKELIEAKEIEIEKFQKQYNAVIEKRMEQHKSLNLIEEGKKNKGKNIKSSDEFLNKWAESVKKGNEEILNSYVKTLTTGLADGVGSNLFGSLIPTVVEEMIERALVDYGGLVSFAKITTIKGNIAINFEKSATGAEMHEEGAAAPTEEEIIIDSKILQPKMIKKWISWTDEIEIMSSVDLAKYLVDEFFEKIILKLEEQMLNGDYLSDKGLIGILKVAAQPNDNRVVEIDGQGVLGFDTTLKMLGMVKSGKKQLKYFMNRKTYFNDVLTIVDTTNKPVYSNKIDENGNTQYLLNGVLVEFIDALVPYEEALAGDYPIILGTKDAYRLNYPSGVSPTYVVDNITKAEEDIKKMVGKSFVAGMPVKLYGMVALKKGEEVVTP